jgi:hypothetical protein
MIAQQSKTFLVWLFTDLRDGLKERMQNSGKGGPDLEQSRRELAIYDVLLAGLSGREAFPDDEAVRQHVVGLAKATDDENGYEQVALEHSAFADLIAELPPASSSIPGRSKSLPLR